MLSLAKLGIYIILNERALCIDTTQSHFLHLSKIYKEDLERGGEKEKKKKRMKKDKKASKQTHRERARVCD